MGIDGGAGLDGQKGEEGELVIPPSLIGLPGMKGEQGPAGRRGVQGPAGAPGDRGFFGLPGSSGLPVRQFLYWIRTFICKRSSVEIILYKTIYDTCFYYERLYPYLAYHDMLVIIYINFFCHMKILNFIER